MKLKKILNELYDEFGNYIQTKQDKANIVKKKERKEFVKRMSDF